MEIMQSIPDESVDMILCDLPYGTTNHKWDVCLPLGPLWREYWRLAKPKAAVVLTAQQPFASITPFTSPIFRLSNISFNFLKLSCTKVILS